MTNLEGELEYMLDNLCLETERAIFILVSHNYDLSDLEGSGYDYWEKYMGMIEFGRETRVENGEAITIRISDMPLKRASRLIWSRPRDYPMAAPLLLAKEDVRKRRFLDAFIHLLRHLDFMFKFTPCYFKEEDDEIDFWHLSKLGQTVLEALAWEVGGPEDTQRSILGGTMANLAHWTSRVIALLPENGSDRANALGWNFKSMWQYLHHINRQAMEDNNGLRCQRYRDFVKRISSEILLWTGPFWYGDRVWMHEIDENDKNWKTVLYRLNPKKKEPCAGLRLRPYIKRRGRIFEFYRYTIEKDLQVLRQATEGEEDEKSENRVDVSDRSGLDSGTDKETRSVR